MIKSYLLKRKMLAWISCPSPLHDQGHGWQSHVTLQERTTSQVMGELPDRWNLGTGKAYVWQEENLYFSKRIYVAFCYREHCLSVPLWRWGSRPWRYFLGPVFKDHHAGHFDWQHLHSDSFLFFSLSFYKLFFLPWDIWIPILFIYDLASWRLIAYWL